MKCSPGQFKMGWNGRFGKMKIQILLTIKNPTIKIIVVIAAGNFKKQSKWREKLHNNNNNT